MGRWLLLLAGALFAVACERKPAGPDLSTPKAAALTFTQALENGDLPTARAASNASGDEGELLEAMAESASGMIRLTSAAGARLGDEARKLAEQHAAIGMTKMIAQGTVDQQGDRATVSTREKAGQMQLQRSDGRWRVDVGALTRGRDVSQVVIFLRAAGLAARQVADDIDAGRLTSLPAAQEAMVMRITANLPRRIREQVIGRARPTTSDVPQL
jgi:hypothetical protein